MWGADTGVIAAGFEVILANDILHFARDVYLNNLPETEFVPGEHRKIQHFPTAPLCCSPLFVGSHIPQGEAFGIGLLCHCRHHWLGWRTAGLSVVGGQCRLEHCTYGILAGGHANLWLPINVHFDISDGFRSGTG